MTPRSIVSYELHGQPWPTKISELGHSLDGEREILFHDGCIPKAPNISHTFNHSETTWEASKWWGNHLPHLDLMQAGDALRWYHMWDYDPPPLVQISVYVLVILPPYMDDVLVLFLDLYGGGGEYEACVYHMGWRLSLYTLVHISGRVGV